jgi:predicted transcriptional regulator
MEGAPRISRNLRLHIVDGLDEASKRLVGAVARHERGETVRERHLSFENWEALFSLLTPRRFELLQHLHRSPEPTIRALARALGRDFKRVYEDVRLLEQAGLIERDDEGLRADYASVETRIEL